MSLKLELSKVNPPNTFAGAVMHLSSALYFCPVLLFFEKKNAIKNNHVISVFISHIVFHYYYCVQSLHLCCVSSYADKWTLLPPTGLQCVCVQECYWCVRNEGNLWDFMCFCSWFYFVIIHYGWKKVLMIAKWLSSKHDRVKICLG